MTRQWPHDIEFLRGQTTARGEHAQGTIRYRVDDYGVAGTCGHAGGLRLGRDVDHRHHHLNGLAMRRGQHSVQQSRSFIGRDVRIRAELACFFDEVKSLYGSSKLTNVACRSLSSPRRCLTSTRSDGATHATSP